MARRLIGSEKFDDAHTDEVQNEIERLMDVILVMNDAARLLRRSLDLRPVVSRDLYRD